MAISEALISKAKVNQPENNRMSYEEFLAWVDEDTHAEWVDGEVIVFMSAKDNHQSSLEFLYELMAFFVRLFNLGKVRIPPYQMRLRSGRSYREPDILFVTREKMALFTENRLDGPADLVVEFVSDDSVQRDRRDKFREYEQEGIREYWIIDPRAGKQRADFYRLDETGRYQLFGIDEDEWVESEVLTRFRLRPQWLWQTESLTPLEAYVEMAGLPDTFVTHLRQQSSEGLSTNPQS